MLRPDELIRPLKFVESSFLQVLVTNFSITRAETGFELELSFRDDDLAISTTAGKTRVIAKIKGFTARADDLSKRLDDVLVYGTKHGYHHPHDDPTPKPCEDFPFRYASGGTLPVIRLEGRDYYCFFYRDIFPVGWNIANGGCCSREELLNPVETIERELREELIIWNKYKKVHFVFGADDGIQFLHRPRFTSDSALTEIIPGWVHGDKAQAPIKWVDGPDCVTVTIRRAEPTLTDQRDVDSREITGCFLNINAEDFGIELDKVARIAITGKASLFDGEQTRNFVLSRIVGLFDVTKLEDELAAGIREFIPDILFHEGEKLYFDGAHEKKSFSPIKDEEDRGNSRAKNECLDDVIDAMVGRLKRVRNDEQRRSFANLGQERYNLCPVTRRIVKRYASFRQSDPSGRSVKVFISYGGDDENTAKAVSDFLKPERRFFFWGFPVRNDVSSAIDKALDSAEWLVLIGTSVSNLNREHCAYEWRRFSQDVRDGFKPGGTIILLLDEGIEPLNLPRELQEKNWLQIPFNSRDEADLRRALAKLSRILPPDIMN